MLKQASLDTEITGHREILMVYIDRERARALDSLRSNRYRNVRALGEKIDTSHLGEGTTKTLEGFQARCALTEGFWLKSRSKLQIELESGCIFFYISRLTGFED
uniref:Uncharacterized protein n=1 Tax=Cyclophora tenuis TaxID=216820 RepID=A0A7S1DAL7_CYCTE|mmetsp:Transcript_430/g.761  ORF Transcript_430/g.761 Transcript_430/m.761 type:complete len:104 (+) Transcript_430:175-486(+)